MKYNILALMVLSSIINFRVVASDMVSVLISENAVMEKNNEAILEQTYVVSDSLRELNPKNKNDVEALADSIEFEVYSISETSQIHTIFMSGSGVCKGYRGRGVDVTDSTTYYFNELSHDQYYANIARGILNEKGDADKLQYASVFNISDLERSKKFKEQEAKYGKDIAEQNLRERTKVLSKVVCKKKRNS